MAAAASFGLIAIRPNEVSFFHLRDVRYKYSMRISEIEIYESPQLMAERFDQSLWLHKIIEGTVKSMTGQTWNPSRYYGTVLTNVFGSQRFHEIYGNFYHIPIYHQVSVQIVNSISASTKFLGVNPDTRIEKILITLIVPKKKLQNDAVITELDSIIGHEINHIKQKIAQHKHNYSASSINPAMHANNMHYARYSPLHSGLLGYYHLSIKEFDSFAYTFGIRLWHQWDDQATAVLPLLHKKLWENNFNASKSIRYGEKRVDVHVVLGLYNFATEFKNAESYGLLQNNLTAKKLWNKLFREIYKYIRTRSDITEE